MRHLLLIFLICLGLPITAQAQDVSLPACDLMDEQIIFWEAIGEKVTLRTKIFGELDTLPSGKFYLTFGNGQEILVGEGGKFIDDFMPDHIPTCQDHLNAAKQPIASSLSGTPTYLWGIPLKTVGDIEKANSLAKECDADETDQSSLYDCRDLKRFAEDMSTRNDVQNENYKRLVKQNAPLIQVPYSAYGIDVYAFDKKTNSMHQLFFSGC